MKYIEAARTFKRLILHKTFMSRVGQELDDRVANLHAVVPFSIGAIAWELGLPMFLQGGDLSPRMS